MSHKVQSSAACSPSFVKKSKSYLPENANLFGFHYAFSSFLLEELRLMGDAPLPFLHIIVKNPQQIS
jgi:hypothetical protein